MPDFTLCSIPDNKKAMFSFTFDDGTKDHLTVAAPELEKRGWHGTFFINSLSNDRLPSARLSADGIRELSKRGHEIALHTMTHRKMDDLAQVGDYAGMAWEIEENIRHLTMITGKRPETYTAPYCGTPDFLKNILRQKNILETPPRAAIGSWTTREQIDEFLSHIANPGTFTVLCIHGVMPGCGSWAPLTGEVFCHILDRVKDMEPDLVVDTFAANGAYQLRRQNASIVPVSEGTWQVLLDAKYSHVYGALSVLDARAGEGQENSVVKVNGIPLTTAGGVFNVFPGDVISH